MKSSNFRRFSTKWVNLFMEPKSLYLSRAVSNFYETDITIWAGFGPDGNAEKKIWADYEQLLRAFFSCFQGQKKMLKNIVASALKSYIAYM